MKWKQGKFIGSLESLGNKVTYRIVATGRAFRLYRIAGGRPQWWDAPTIEEAKRKASAVQLLYAKQQEFELV